VVLGSNTCPERLVIVRLQLNAVGVQMMHVYNFSEVTGSVRRLRPYHVSVNVTKLKCEENAKLSVKHNLLIYSREQSPS
jgi:hypothetical protein